MANDKTYYVLLNREGGGKLRKITGVDSYTFSSETCRGELYRDIFRSANADDDFATAPAEGDDPATDPRVAKLSDDIAHVTPRQTTYVRHYHLFSSTSGVLARVWDEYVIGVFNSPDVSP